MAPRHRSQSLRKEHEKLLRLADGIENMLALASKNVFEEHLRGLNGLRSLEHRLAGIEEHCQAEDSTVKGTFQDSLLEDERVRIDAEHEQIIRAVTNFREELKCATADRTMAMILPGMDVVNHLRAHIAFEREMLGRIADLGATQKSRSGQKKTGKKTHGKQRSRLAKSKTKRKTKGILPYTLEPHPEL